MKKMDKKGISLWALPSIIVLLVVIAIILSVGSDVNQDIMDDAKTSAGMTDVNGTFAYNASQRGLMGIQAVADWQDNWGLIIGAAAVLAIIMGTLAFVGMRQG